MTSAYILCQVTVIGEGDWPAPIAAYSTRDEAMIAERHMESNAPTKDYLEREVYYCVMTLDMNPAIRVLDGFIEDEVQYIEEVAAHGSAAWLE